MACALKTPVVVEQASFLALFAGAQQLVVSLEMGRQRFKDIALLVLEVFGAHDVKIRVLGDIDHDVEELHELSSITVFFLADFLDRFGWLVRL